MASGEDVGSLLPDDPRIRCLHLEGQPPIGAKRNFGCEQAGGSIIVHWDDDDYSSPGRIADQVMRLEGSGQPVTGYRTMRFTNGTESWLYRGGPLFALGTSLCYRKSWWTKHPFPGLHVGEDNHFVAEAAEHGAISTAEAGELMYATIHPGNTSPRNLNASNWTKL